MAEPKFRIGDYVYASDQPDCGQGTIVFCRRVGGFWEYQIRVPGNESGHVTWYEHYLILMSRPQSTDAGAAEYEEIMEAQKLLEE